MNERDDIVCRKCGCRGWSVTLAKANGWITHGETWTCAACHRWPERDPTVDDPHERLS